MLFRILFFATILYDSVTAVRSQVCNASSVDGLVAEYEREELPPASPLPVELMLEVRHAAVVENHSALRVLADLTMSWQDSRLSWNASEWGCDSAGVSAERLWRPDVEALNAAAAPAGPPLAARIQSTGVVSYTARLDLSVPMALDLTNWPDDLQTATLRFASRTHTVDEIDLTIKQGKVVMMVFESGAWELVSVSNSLSTWEGVAGDRARREAGWSVQVRRRAPVQAAVCGALLGACAVQLLAAALLPPARRAPLAASAAFIACFWLIAWSGRLGHSGTVPVRVWAMCWSALVSCVCAAAACVVLRLSRVAAPPPPKLRAALSKLAPFCALTPLQAESGESSGGGAAWGAAALVLDRALLGVLLVAMLAVLCVGV